MKFFTISVSAVEDLWASKVVNAQDETTARTLVQGTLPSGWVVITVNPTESEPGEVHGGKNIKPFLPDLSI